MISENEIKFLFDNLIDSDIHTTIDFIINLDKTKNYQELLDEYDELSNSDINVEKITIQDLKNSNVTKERLNKYIEIKIESSENIDEPLSQIDIDKLYNIINEKEKKPAIKRRKM